ncbi:hypothetical protein JYU34_006703 [Plutella xylostella]|uniref:SCP domain-containing protein n=1 Tax=Plutella xylostella TaxID=51655 RepID=A0ABQ7QST0_PLUXY|nr:hypothetical protein JYU34_006703 [Plutella xylostella]
MFAKFHVLFMFLPGILCFHSNYCDVCPKHVLCKYNSSGPGPSCRGYDGGALLTRAEVRAVLERVNRRRGQVARGGAPGLPTAANMNTVSWSKELAVLAQRWADQCDPHTRPDRTDDCRDLPGLKIGQSVASVAGASAGLRVGALVDTWFTQALEYSGSVSYYDSFQDRHTEYFTQLIWADTYAVGCGKVKFHSSNGKSVITRLVCNFAPSGNTHGKPVYLIGFPATQCAEGSSPDARHQGLCSRPAAPERKPYGAPKSTLPMFVPIKTKSTTVSSLLRILNLYNKSDSAEMDSSTSNIKLQTSKFYPNNQKGIDKLQNMLNKTRIGNKFLLNSDNVKNLSRRQMYRDHEEMRGHSHVHHDPGHVQEPSTSSDNFRGFQRENEKCSRRPAGGANAECKTNRCTRTDEKIYCCSETSESSLLFDRLAANRPQYANQQDQCSCFAVPLAPPLCPPPAPPNCNNCPCVVQHQCSTSIQCKNCRGKNYEPKPNKTPPDLHYIDLIPKVSHLRNGDESLEKDFKYTDDYFLTTNPNYQSTENSQHTIKNINPLKIKLHNNDRTEPDREYPYDMLYLNHRNNREIVDEVTTSKPFWQMAEYDNYDNTKPVQLKALRYTTLRDPRNRYAKNTQMIRATEPITIVRTNLSEDNQKHPAREKLLSFDELINLRKNTSPKLHFFARRKGEDTTPTTATTTTPTTTISKPTFPRIKYCTRKLTCTWTVNTKDIGGGAKPGGGAGGGAGKPRHTVPGFVEGCSRTSTCTREFMDKNIGFGKDYDVPNDDEEEGSGDEEYCERRSLDVRRRESVKKKSVYSQVQNDDEVESTSFHSTNLIEPDYTALSTETTSTSANDGDCLCDAYNKKSKRNAMYQRHERTTAQKINTYLTYENMYYSVLEKILNMYKTKEKFNKNCWCHNSVNSSFKITYLFFVVVMNFICTIII